MTCTIICGDVRDMPVKGKFHAVLTDAPYELGFMGKSWDASGVAYDVEVWKGILALLHPGAWMMAFGGSRGWHRLAVAVEDAGFRIHPSLFVWATGTSFPKATRIDTQIDKAAGAEREVVGKQVGAQAESAGQYGAWGNDNGKGQSEFDLTAPATPLAQAWEGHRYGGQVLKNAADPIIVAQKRFEGRPVDNITETGAGALWVDGGRIGLNGERRPTGSGDRTGSPIYAQDEWTQTQMSRGANTTPISGRWPSNLILQHTELCTRLGEKRVRGRQGGDRQRVTPKAGGNGHTMGGGWNGEITEHTYADADGLETVAEWDCVPECPVRKLGEQSGESRSSDRPRHNKARPASVAKGAEYDHTTGGFVDSGTAARYFQQVGWELDNAEPVRYQAKASRRERDAGLEERSNHPTHKPIALAKYLATLLLPPPEYAPRRLLIPFGGVGSEVIGALLAGWEEVVMIEQSEEYCQIAAARVKWWAERMQETGSVDVKVLLKPGRKRNSAQPVML